MKMSTLFTKTRKEAPQGEAALKKLIEWHIAEGTDAIVPCGTTGESATLDYKEHHRVIELTVETVKGRVPVIAGTGANSTDEAIMITRGAMEAGADGALLVSPYYNKPSQEGIYRHYKAIADGVKGFPLVLYNVPGRTAVNMLPDTVARLSEIDNIIGIKEATADMEQSSWLRKLCTDDFILLSGDDATLLPFLSIGGDGVISVLSNVAPGEISALCKAWREGDIEEASKLHYKLLPLAKTMFCETNPIPVKEAVHMMGMMSEEIRLPLTRLTETNRIELARAMKELGLIQGN